MICQKCQKTKWCISWGGTQGCLSDLVMDLLLLFIIEEKYLLKRNYLIYMYCFDCKILTYSSVCINHKIDGMCGITGLDTPFWQNLPLWKVSLKIYFPQPVNVPFSIEESIFFTCHNHKSLTNSGSNSLVIFLFFHIFLVTLAVLGLVLLDSLAKFHCYI